MNLGISQPTFLPWCGYFGLLNYVDEFVILPICSKFEARCRSYELLAKEFDLAPRGI